MWSRTGTDWAMKLCQQFMRIESCLRVKKICNEYQEAGSRDDCKKFPNQQKSSFVHSNN